MPFVQWQPTQGIGVCVFFTFLVPDGVTVSSEGDSPSLNSSSSQNCSSFCFAEDMNQWFVICFKLEMSAIQVLVILADPEYQS